MRHIQRPGNIAVLSVLLVSACFVIALDAGASQPTAAAKPPLSVTTD